MNFKRLKLLLLILVLMLFCGNKTVLAREANDESKELLKENNINLDLKKFIPLNEKDSNSIKELDRLDNDLEIQEYDGNYIGIGKEGAIEYLDLLDGIGKQQTMPLRKPLRTYKNADNLKEDIIKELKDNKMVDDDYVLYETYPIFEQYTQMILTKESRINNIFDNVSIIVDNLTGQIIHFSKQKDFILNDIGVSKIENKEKDVREIVDRFLIENSKPGLKISGINLKVIKLDHPYLIENKDKISRIYNNEYFIGYDVELTNGIRIYVDGETLNLVYLDDVENSTSFYDREKGRYRWERAKNIAAVMGLKGLPGGQVGVSSNGTHNKSSILYNINTNTNQRGFSFTGRSTNNGNAMFLTSSSQNGSTPHVIIKSSECRTNSRWKMVFMDMCQSEAANTWASVFNIWSSSKGKVLLGWRGNVGVSTSYVYTTNLKNNCERYRSNSLYSNSVRAVKQTNSAGYNASILNYRGDQNF